MISFIKKLFSSKKFLSVNSILAFFIASSPLQAADVSWITKIHNNSKETFYMTAKAGANLGCAYLGGRLMGCNDKDGVIKLKPQTTYETSWMGIPYYEAGYGERVLHPGGPNWKKEGIYTYQTSRGGKPMIDWKRLDGEMIDFQSVASCGKSEYELYIHPNSTVTLDLVWSQCQDWETIAKTVEKMYEVADKSLDLAIKYKKATK